VAGLQQQIKSLFILIFKAAFSSLFDWGDLHARAQTLARVRRGRMDLSDRWDSSGRTARDNYLTCYPLRQRFLSPANSASTRHERPHDSRAAEQCDEFAPLRPPRRQAGQVMNRGGALSRLRRFRPKA
jgi:hypothetical protein